ncbi:MAG: PfkB family carbohydrate kinase [Bryobacteraceae bacterium]
MSGLDIPREGALGLLSLGALVYRLDPGVVPFRKATECKIHVSGGEFNVAANLANCFGIPTGIASAMVDYPIGDLIAERVRAMGVQPFYKKFEHNGVTGPNMATVYSDRGFGVRPPVVFYNRANEAGAMLKPGDFDWNAIFSPGVRWFHSGGVFAALSPTSGDLIVEAMRAARAAGSVVSFDLNFREKLWSVWGGADRALPILRRIVENVDVLVGGVEDLRNGLGARDVAEAVRDYPQLKIVATSRREVHSANRHSWSARAWVSGATPEDQTYLTPTCELDIYDRVGGGDGFAAGFFYGLLAGESPEDALRLGWAHGALVTTFPGDTTMATLDQVRAFAQGGSARIQR